MLLPISKRARHATAPGNMLTARQADVLIFLWDFYRENDQLPPCHVIAGRFGFSSDNAAHEHLSALAEKGWIERNAVGKWKFGITARAHMELAEYADQCSQAGTLVKSVPVEA